MDLIKQEESAIEAAQEQEQAALIDLIGAIVLAFIASLNADQVASTLDDSDRDHIRRQLDTIMERERDGLPRTIEFAAARSRLIDYTRMVAGRAAAMASHSLDASDTDRLTRKASDFLDTFRADTATALSAAIEKAIASKAAPYERATHLKRSIGLSVKQQVALDTMRQTLHAYANAPRSFIPERSTANGNTRPARYERTINTSKLIAEARGKVSAAQMGVLKKALAKPSLTPSDADLILDRHANALRRHRIIMSVAQGLHEITESTKLTTWQLAQADGALPATQRRYWRTAGDERVRIAHSQVPSINPGGVKLNEPFDTPFGKVMFPPLEIGCRCRATLRKAQ